MVDRVGGIVASILVIATITAILYRGTQATQVEGGFFNGFSKVLDTAIKG